MPTLNESLCAKDGVCTRACPVAVLIRSADGSPQMRPGARCLACGHCMSVCPKGALSLEGLAAEDLEALAPDWRLDAQRVGQLLKGRRSIRVFGRDPLPREVLEQMIALAQYAPSGHNTQPLAWTVVSGDGVRRIAEATIAWMKASIAGGSPLAAALDMAGLVSAWDLGNDMICREAPHLVVPHAPAELPAGSLFGAIAMTYLELAALPLGAGTCWAGFVLIGAGVSPEVHAALQLPDGRRCAGVVMAGRPAVTYRRIPARNQPTVAWQ